MTITDHPPVKHERAVDALPRRLGRGLLYCAGLIPLSTAALLSALGGRPTTAAGWLHAWQRRVLGAAPVALPGGRVAAVAADAAVGVLLGVLAVIPLGVQILFIARGVLYGFVDRGPYDTSWGGPSRAGAWAMHFLVSVPIAGAGLFMLAGLAALHLAWSRRLAGQRGSRWLLPITALISVAVAIVFVAWTRQI